MPDSEAFFMPSLDAKASSGVDEMRNVGSSGGLIVCNAFLIARLVVLVLLANFAFLALVFAAWNVNANLSLNYAAPGTSTFVIFESCLVFCFVAYAVSEFFLPNVRLFKPILECGFIGVLSVFYIASAVSASVQNSSSSCRQSYDWNICASSSLLVPLTWLNTVISLGYFLAFFMTIMAHKHSRPDIWTRSLYDIEWFGQPPVGSRKDNNFKLMAPYDKAQYGRFKKEIFRPKDPGEVAAPWASPGTIRRGVDLPFVKKPSQLSGGSTAVNATSPPPPLSLPSRAANGTVSSSGSRFIERFRESALLARPPETTGQFSGHYHARTDSSSFPRSVDDVNQPIPLPSMSEWISADGRQVSRMDGPSKQNRRWI